MDHVVKFAGALGPQGPPITGAKWTFYPRTSGTNWGKRRKGRRWSSWYTGCHGTIGIPRTRWKPGLTKCECKSQSWSTGLGNK
uniref:Uncharacterized protein n=1 Tax=Sphaerodactylus townsendi TaxID=933632 RepID=A0ACB8FEN4_9SAUR